MALADLGRRVAVAAVGIPVVLALLYLGGWALAVPVAVLAVLGAGELFDLAEARGGRPLRSVGYVLSAAIVLAAAWDGTFGGTSTWFTGLMLVAAGASMAMAMRARWPGGTPLRDVATTLAAGVYVALPLTFVPLLHVLPGREGWEGGDGPWAGLGVVALPLAATWIADAAAYFAGTTWGESKLAPSISPNKSLVGAVASLVGGAAAGVLWFEIVGSWLPGRPGSAVVAAGMGVALSVGAQIGDLVESVLKREAGVKDSGTAFPGHGGVLDRLDALLYTLPLSYVLLLGVGWLT